MYRRARDNLVVSRRFPPDRFAFGQLKENSRAQGVNGDTFEERETISDAARRINTVQLKSGAVTGSLCRVVTISRLFFVREKQVRRHGIDRSFDISRASSLAVGDQRVERGSNSLNAPFSPDLSVSMIERAPRFLPTIPGDKRGRGSSLVSNYYVSMGSLVENWSGWRAPLIRTLMQSRLILCHPFSTSRRTV